MSNNLIAGNLPKKLIQPTNMAIATSVILHGLVFYFGLPNLMSDRPLEDSSVDLSRSVPTIELTPAEQSRLPDLSNSLAQLPILNQPTPNLPQSQGLPPVPPPPPLPSANSNSLPQPFLAPLPPNLPSIPLPPPPPTNPLPASPLSIKLPPPPPNSKFPVAKNLPAPPPPPNFDRGSQPLVPSLPPPNLNPQQPIKNSSLQPTQPIQPTQPVAPTKEQIIAQRQQNLLASIGQLGKNLQKDERNTSSEEANKNYVDWLTKVKVAQPKVTNFTGTYPKDACLRRLEGSASYGVVVDPQGNIVETELIKSAGYPILNKQALRDLNAQRFPNRSGQLQPYQVNISFEYNRQVCPSLGMSRSRIPESSREIKNRLSPIPTPAPMPGTNNLPTQAPLPAAKPEINN